MWFVQHKHKHATSWIRIHLQEMRNQDIFAWFLSALGAPGCSVLSVLKWTAHVAADPLVCQCSAASSGAVWGWLSAPRQFIQPESPVSQPAAFRFMNKAWTTLNCNIHLNQFTLKPLHSNQWNFLWFFCPLWLLMEQLEDFSRIKCLNVYLMKIQDYSCAGFLRE